MGTNTPVPEKKAYPDEHFQAKMLFPWIFADEFPEAGTAEQW